MRHDVTLPIIGEEVTEGAPLLLVEPNKAQVGQVIATLEVP
jgi:hypothetical protein